MENINNEMTLSKPGHDRVLKKQYLTKSTTTTTKKCADNHSGSTLNKNESNIQCECLLNRKRGRAIVSDNDKPPKMFKKERENALSDKKNKNIEIKNKIVQTYPSIQSENDKGQCSHKDSIFKLFYSHKHLFYIYKEEMHGVLKLNRD